MFFPWDIFCSQLSLVWALKGHLLHGGPSRLQGTNVFNCLFYHNNRNYSHYLLVTTTKLKESNNKNRSKHNLKKKLQFFSCSQADVMFFFFPKVFPSSELFPPSLCSVMLQHSMLCQSLDAARSPLVCTVCLSGSENADSICFAIARGCRRVHIVCEVREIPLRVFPLFFWGAHSSQALCF